ncbi:MAG: tetratricopeptide repeat protein, partial [Planctomycetota bacterium]
MRAGFIWEDDLNIQNNLTLRSADGLQQIWFQIDSSPQYYPMTYTTYWLEYQLWKLNPTGYHVVNILLHAAGTVLLWRVLTALQVPGALIAAAIFALHPVHVESVAWITERKNVLSGVFYFSSALMYFRYALGPENTLSCRGPARFYAASLVLFLCALLSKTAVCMLPVVFLLVLWWKRNRIGWADVRALLPFCTLAIILAVLTVWVEKRHVGAVGQEWNQSFIERCLIAGRSLCFYAGKLFWPKQLTMLYPRWQIDAHIWQQYLYPTAVIIVMAAFCFARKRIGKGPLVAFLCFTATLFPVLGFFDIAFSRYSFVSDHFQYLAGISLIVLVMAVGYRTVDQIGRWGKNIAIVFVVPILVILGILTWRQEYPYLNNETLWRDTLNKNPNNWVAHNNLGVTLNLQGRFDEAIDHYRQVLQIKPNDVEAHHNLGI